MNQFIYIRSIVAMSATLMVSAFSVEAADTLPKNARLAIIGDSITEQKLYSKYMETYLLACSDRPDIKVFQYGWGGETAWGFNWRLENDLLPFQPTIATTCYGMNDGQYRPINDEIANGYETNMRRLAEGLKKIGVQYIVLGSPGAVDTKYFTRNNFAPLSGADGYNKNLAALGDLDKKLAGSLGVVYADVHHPMVDVMAKAKTAFGNDYDVCGRDGVHPGPNGHLVMAYAFLKALGCDGAIGEITVDMKGASTAVGHKASGSNGKAELESTRYPFCFEGDAKSPNGTRSILPFFPFNQDLNRLVLKVKNLDAAKATVTWGETSKEFTREQLTAGVNLAAEFDKTPFDEAFRNVLRAVGNKQNFETTAIKSMITNFRQFNDVTKTDADLAASFKSVTQSLMTRQAALDAEARKAIVPVKHTLVVKPAAN